MLFRKAILPLSVLPLVLAIPDAWGKHGPGDRGECLSDAEAQFLVDIMVSFSVSFDPNYAGQFLADDFTVQSDSINILTGGLLKVCLSLSHGSENPVRCRCEKYACIPGLELLWTSLTLRWN
jgi:hypothetical protein